MIDDGVLNDDNVSNSVIYTYHLGMVLPRVKLVVLGQVHGIGFTK